MKDFTRSQGRLRALSFEARFVYSIFLVFTLGGFVLTAVLLDDMIGIELSGATEYYAGGSVSDDGLVDDNGPQVNLPSDAEEFYQEDPMPRRKLLEVTHFHLFSMPVYLLILSHLFMLSRARRTTKWLWIGAATLGTGLHIAAPWCATSGTGASIAFYAVSGVLMTAGYLAMTVLPLWEMWTPRLTR